MKYNILKLNEISEKADKIFDKKYKFSKDCKEPHAVMLRSFSMHDWELPKSLLAVARAGAGVNNIPIDKCTANGIVVFNTPGANANAVKELIICAMLLGSRKIIDAIEWTKTLAGKGNEVLPLVEKGKNKFVGGEIFGKTLGVIGLGAIGAIVANAACALGMNVLGYDPFISVDSAWGLSRNVHRCTDLNDLYATCDYITINMPYNKDTKHTINAEKIDLMKEGVVIINCSRGELVDNAALLEAVATCKVARYVTDFPSEELLNKENIICIPHLGASTPEAEDNCAVAAANELVDFLENGNIKNSVNFPYIYIPRSEGTTRLTIIHKNVAEMISKISSRFGARKQNISNFASKSKGDYAYAILDIDGEVSDEIISELNAMPDIIKVRVLS